MFIITIRYTLYIIVGEAANKKVPPLVARPLRGEGGDKTGQLRKKNFFEIYSLFFIFGKKYCSFSQTILGRKNAILRMLKKKKFLMAVKLEGG